MGEFIVEDVKWKKGESGFQEFILYESDGKTKRNGTGKSYSFKFWKRGTGIVKGSGTLIAIDEVEGHWKYNLQASDTNTVDNYAGEIIEDPSGTGMRSETFNVGVEESSA